MAWTKSILAAGAVLAMSFGLTACGSESNASSARTQFEREGDFAKGSPDAPLTMIEYASTACGACAQYHVNAMPGIEEQIEAGNVRFVMRERLTGQPQVAAAGFMLARCAPEDRYFDMIDVLFEQQRAIFEAGQRGAMRQHLQTVARSVGFSEADFEACLTNEEILNDVQAASRQASEDGVTGTPTFLVNGKDFGGDRLEGYEGGVFVWDGEPVLIDGEAVTFSLEADAWSRVLAHLATQEG